MTTTINYKDADLCIDFEIQETSGFYEDFGCGLELCEPYGNGASVRITDVYVCEYIEITTLLSDVDIEELERLIALEL